MLMYDNLCNWYANDHLTPTTQLSVVANTFIWGTATVTELSINAIYTTAIFVKYQIWLCEDHDLFFFFVLSYPTMAERKKYILKY